MSVREALEAARARLSPQAVMCNDEALVEQIDAALRQLDEAEPVAWRIPVRDGYVYGSSKEVAEANHADFMTLFDGDDDSADAIGPAQPLYAAPPAPSDAECEQLANWCEENFILTKDLFPEAAQNYRRIAAILRGERNE